MCAVLAMATMENNVRAASAIIKLIPIERLNTGMYELNDYTCLQYAATHTSLHKMLTYFLTIDGIDVNVDVGNLRHYGPRRRGVGALRLAADNADVNAVTTLLQSPDVDVNAADVDGVAPVHRAVLLGDVDVVAALTRHRWIRLNVCDGRGNSHLHYANMLSDEEGRVRMVKYLLTLKDIDVNLRNSDGLTPLEQAMDLGHTRTVQLLREHPTTTDDAKRQHG